MEKPHHLQWGRAGTSNAMEVKLRTREALLPATSNPGVTVTGLGFWDLTLTLSSLSLNYCSLPLSFLSWPSTRQSFWILLPTSCPSPGLNISPPSHPPSSWPLLGSNLSSPCCSIKIARYGRPSTPPRHPCNTGSGSLLLPPAQSSLFIVAKYNHNFPLFRTFCGSSLLIRLSTCQGSLGPNQANGSVSQAVPCPRILAQLCVSPPGLPIKARHRALG